MTTCVFKTVSSPTQKLLCYRAEYNRSYWIAGYGFDWFGEKYSMKIPNLVEKSERELGKSIFYGAYGTFCTIISTPRFYHGVKEHFDFMKKQQIIVKIIRGNSIKTIGLGL